MTEQTAPVEIKDQTRVLPEYVTPDTRPGYSGNLLPATNLLEFASIARDNLGYDYLSSVTGVDYIAEGLMEMVYHVYKTTGGPALVFKVQVPRDQPEVPSIVSIYPGAELQEREAWDLFGVRFTGHPDLRRYFYGKALPVTRCARIGKNLTSKKKANPSKALA